MQFDHKHRHKHAQLCKGKHSLGVTDRSLILWNVLGWIGGGLLLWVSAELVKATVEGRVEVKGAVHHHAKQIYTAKTPNLTRFICLICSHIRHSDQTSVILVRCRCLFLDVSSNYMWIFTFFYFYQAKKHAEVISFFLFCSVVCTCCDAYPMFLNYSLFLHRHKVAHAQSVARDWNNSDESGTMTKNLSVW